MTNPATKQSIIRMTARVTGQSQRQTRETADVLLHIIGQLTAQGHRVRWPGLGTFDLAHRAARIGHNPRTGKPMIVKARNAVRFRAAGSLKAAANQ